METISDFLIQDGVLLKYTGEDVKITIPEGVAEVDKNAFRGKELEEVVFPKSLKKMPEALLYPPSKCMVFQSNFVNRDRYSHGFNAGVFFPVSESEIEAWQSSKHNMGIILAGNSICEFSIIGESDKYVVKDGILFDSAMEVLIRYPSNRKNTSYEVPDTVKVICSYAFYGSQFLKEITLPSGLQAIGKETFGSCDALAGIKIPNGVEKIPARCFSSCKRLAIVELPELLKTIGDGAFQYCVALANLDMPQAVTEIGNDAFYETGLEALTLPAALISLGRNLISSGDRWDRNTTLKDIYIPEGFNFDVLRNSNAFEGCTALKTIHVPDSFDSQIYNRYFPQNAKFVMLEQTATASPIKKEEKQMTEHYFKVRYQKDGCRTSTCRNVFETIEEAKDYIDDRFGDSDGEVLVEILDETGKCVHTSYL